MNKFITVDDIPEIPSVKTQREQDLLCAELIECGAIPKSKLIVGNTYAGSSRNTSKAVWNGKEFEYQRNKWGSTFMDTIAHFEDEMYYDVFVPIYCIESKVLEARISQHHFKTFPKSNHSPFQYWYYHWKAFNLTAYYLGCWKFKYLFHDIEKPWLKLFLKSDKIQKIHRRNNKHHLSYKGGIDKVDIQALIIDMECSRFTKSEAQLNAREFLTKLFKENKITEDFFEKCNKLLIRFNL